MKPASFKLLYQSKTFWINAIGLALAFEQWWSGRTVVDPQMQLYILAAANILVRIFTTSPIVFTQRGAYLRIARYLDQFGFKWRDTERAKTIVSQFVIRKFGK